MDVRKIAFLLLVIVLSVGFAFGYTASTGTTSGGGGGGGGGGGDLSACEDGDDNDNDGLTDGDDPGCTKPYHEDDSEKSIWDTDLTTTMDDDSPSLSTDRSVFFDGVVYEGDEGDRDAYPDSGSLNEKYINNPTTWEGGSPATKSYDSSDFPSGTHFVNDRVIDPPNPDGSDNCGDGLESNDPTPDNGQTNPYNSDTPCRSDWGRYAEAYFIKDADTDYDPDSNYLRDSLTCEDDKAECDEDTGKVECSSSSCSGSCDDGCDSTDASCSVTDECNVDCYITEDNSDDEQNDYWYTSGDSLKKESCTNDGGDIAQVHRQSTPTDELYTRLKKHVNSPYVLILDEVDQLEDDKVLYDLNSIPNVYLVMIANTEESVFYNMDDRVRSRLMGVKRLRFKEYTPDQLEDILSARADKGLRPGAIDRNGIKKIALSAEGDAPLFKCPLVYMLYR